MGRMSRESGESREPADGDGADELPEYAERVLDVAESIPSGG
ncbi:hypothetical protein GCM10017744_040430 [Streptomyces antimycoticus]